MKLAKNVGAGLILTLIVILPGLSNADISVRHLPPNWYRAFYRDDCTHSLNPSVSNPDLYIWFRGRWLPHQNYHVIRRNRNLDSLHEEINLLETHVSRFPSEHTLFNRDKAVKGLRVKLVQLTKKNIITLAGRVTQEMQNDMLTVKPDMFTGNATVDIPLSEIKAIYVEVVPE